MSYQFSHEVSEQKSQKTVPKIKKLCSMKCLVEYLTRRSAKMFVPFNTGAPVFRPQYDRPGVGDSKSPVFPIQLSFLSICQKSGDHPDFKHSGGTSYAGVKCYCQKIRRKKYEAEITLNSLFGSAPGKNIG